MMSPDAREALRAGPRRRRALRRAALPLHLAPRGRRRRRAGRRRRTATRCAAACAVCAEHRLPVTRARQRLQHPGARRRDRGRGAAPPARCARCAATGRGDLVAEAGVSHATVTRHCVEQGLAGLEFAAGIPGSVGGWVAMNAGVPEREVKDVVRAVEVMEAGGARRCLPRRRAALRVPARRGLPGGAVVVAAAFRVRESSREAVQGEVDRHLAKRARTQPLDVPSCGSVFKNPPGDFAGRLIEAAGLKGARRGGRRDLDRARQLHREPRRRHRPRRARADRRGARRGARAHAASSSSPRSASWGGRRREGGNAVGDRRPRRPRAAAPAPPRRPPRTAAPLGGASARCSSRSGPRRRALGLAAGCAPRSRCWRGSAPRCSPSRASRWSARGTPRAEEIVARARARRGHARARGRRARAAAPRRGPSLGGAGARHPAAPGPRAGGGRGARAGRRRAARQPADALLARRRGACRSCPSARRDAGGRIAVVGPEERAAGRAPTRASPRASRSPALSARHGIRGARGAGRAQPSRRSSRPWCSRAARGSCSAPGDHDAKLARLARAAARRGCPRWRPRGRSICASETGWCSGAARPRSARRALRGRAEARPRPTQGRAARPAARLHGG